MAGKCCAPAAPTCKRRIDSDNSGTVYNGGAPSRLEKKCGCDCDSEQQNEETGTNVGAMV